MESIKEYLANPTTFLENMNIEKLIEIAKIADDYYYNKTSIMTDNEYDILIDRIRFLEPKNKYLQSVGFKVRTKKIKLPYYMGSMNKIKPQDEKLINKFKNKFNNIENNKYCISDKLDGISALLIINNNEENKLYTRGDGKKGTDISKLLDIININIKNIKNKLVIRGEIIISKNKFKKYNKMANARNMVSGIINSKKIDNNIACDLDFVAYELINPWLNFQEQFNLLQKTNLNIVNHFFVDNFEIPDLIKYLNDRKNNSIYECDGIIVSYTYPSKRLNSNIDKNPDYAFAFKNSDMNETADVKVLNVEWNISKDKYIKPRLVLEPTHLSGIVIEHVTGFNAKYIVDNNIGIGTIIKLIRSGDVIPHIVEIIKPSKKPLLPKYKYHWTESGVDIIYDGTDNREHLIKNLTWFCKKLEIIDINEKIIEKFIEAGIDNINKIITVTKEDLKNVEHFKDKMIDKIYKNIHEKTKNLNLRNFMIASNSFGHGIGEKKINKILDIYPDIIFLYIEKSKKEIIKMISEIYNFDIITAKQFVSNINNFLELLNSLPKEIQEKILYINNNIQEKKIDKKIEDMKILFSGFRNKEWEEIIINKGGNIVSSISKNTSILVSTQKDIDKQSNSKIIKAIELNIKIMNMEDFYNEYINS